MKQKIRLIRRRKKTENLDDELYILAFSVMHDDVVSAANQYYQDRQLKLRHISPVYRRQYRSVFQYFQKYGKAPRRTIKFIHEGQKAKLLSDEIQLDEQLLEVIAKEYRSAREGYTVSPNYIISDMIPRFIRNRKIEEINIKIGDSIESGDTEKAEKYITQYHEVTSEPPDYTYGFTEPLTIDYHIELIKRNRLEGPKEVFKFDTNSGAIGALIGPLKRQWLVSVSGSTKSGKSYFLLSLAIEAALMQKRKVMLLCPEMSEDDMVEERIAAWITKRTTNPDLVGDHYLPKIDCVNNQTCQCQVLKKPLNAKPLIIKTGDKYSDIMADDKLCTKWKICTECRGKKKQSKVYRKRFWPAVFFEKTNIMKSNKIVRLRKLRDLQDRTVENFKIKYFPKYSATIEESFRIIKNYIEKHKWNPDIIIYDYLDIFKPSSDNKEMTWQDIDHMWKQASGFAQEMDALVITADQTTKAGRTSRILDHTVTPQASSKDHQVDKKIGIAKIGEETKNNICRINVIYDRHRPFNRSSEVLVTQNLTFGDAFLDSVFWYDQNMPPYPIHLPEKE